MQKRKLRMGMIGGGPGSFIGPVHRMAALLDGEIEIVCGAFSSDAEKSKTTGAELGLEINRVYGSFKEMIRREAELPVNQRMEIVSIVTPNHLHFEPAQLAIGSGFHVIMDKPMTFSLEEAEKLRALLNNSPLRFCLTYTYTGYAMVKEARQQVIAGKLGRIRKVYVDYPQGWLSTNVESSGNSQASWRTDPARSGAGGALADIGVHAFNLAEYITCQKVTAVCADVNKIVEGRKLDDDAAVLLRFGNGASGVLIATQVATGEENNISIRIYGELASVEWRHCDADTLLFRYPDRPMETWRSGTSYRGDHANHNTRLPSGHSEGLIGAFANIYRNFALSIKANQDKQQPQPVYEYPGIEEGYRGMLFIERALESAGNNSKWMEMVRGE
jgi:predicted dehydrogenase